MKTTEIIKNCKITFMISVILLVSFEAIAQRETTDNKTLSPYFFVQSDDPGLDQLPLKSTITEVDIAGVIADVKVKQVYKNEGTRPLEAIYIFPASTQAAVYGLKMTIGERTIIAKIEESEKARQDYEEARQHGKTASLLEQKRPNVFQMSVANIMPGDKIVVELSYTELIVPDEGVYEFVYPTVVGPRYSNTPEDIASANEMWVSNPYTHEGENPFYTFDLSINLMAGLPVNDVVCTSHDININFTRKNEVFVSLLDSEKFGGNRDFILKYKLQGNQIESGLLLYKGEEENFFLAMIQPPKHIKPENIPTREYVFIIDVSGSMFGFPLDVSKELVKTLLSNLKPSDRFNILLFAGGSSLFAEQSIQASESNIKKGFNFIDRQNGGGGTELLSALKRALALKEREISLKFKGTKEYARSFVILTDGYISVEKETFDLIRKNLGTANFFTFGIGSSVNRYLLEGMAHIGKGIPFVAINQNEAEEMADKFRKYVENPVLTNINMNFNGFDVYDVEPLEIPDVFSERPVFIYGKYKGSPTGSIELTGSTGNIIFQQKLEVSKFKNHKSNSALKYLWAREKIRILDDYTNLAQNSEHVDEITSLGLKYNLLTAYTSFIAIDSEARNENGNLTTVKQPLPLPKGVSNNAVGKSMYMGGVQSRGNGCKKSGGAIKEYLAIECVDSEIGLQENPDIFSQPQFMPEFIGGEKAFEKFISNNLVYPDEAKNKGIKGTVYIEFVVNPDGTIEDILIKRSVNYLIDKEAIRLIKLTSGKWKPAKQHGKAVKTKITIPVKFEI